MTSTSISKHIVDTLVSQGRNILHHSYLKRHKLAPHTAGILRRESEEFMAHIGCQIDINSSNWRSEDKVPMQISKDHLCCLSIKARKHIVHPRKGNAQSPSIKRRKATSSNYNRLVCAADNFHKASKLAKPKAEQCMKLKGKYFTQNVSAKQQEEQMGQDKMREQILNKKSQEWQKQQKNCLNSAQEYKRKLLLQDQFQNHLNSNNNEFTYDCDGTLILIKEQHENDSPFPYTIDYQLAQKLDNQTFQRARQSSALYQKLRAAKGEVFASAVMKTVNLSCFSINNSTRPNSDPLKFMAKNDLYNNNHLRQTTNIPHLAPKQGTVYTQLGTRQTLGSKQVSTKSSLSGRRSSFKRYWGCSQNAGLIGEQFFEGEQNRQATKTAEQTTRTKALKPRPATCDRRWGNKITTVSRELASLME